MGKNQSKNQFDQLMDASIEFRMNAKQMEKDAGRAEAKAQQEKKKAKQYMDKGDMESAKIIAGEAIRYSNESTNLYRMSGKMQAVSSKLDSAVRAQQVSQQISEAVPSMKNALKKLEKTGIGKNMADFEKVFEDLDVQTADMSGVMDGMVGQSSADSEAVTNLLAQMQGAGALDAQSQMGQVNANQIANPNPVPVQAEANDVSDMERRLAALR